MGDISGRINYETDHTATLQSIWEANGKKESDFKVFKDWSDKARENRNKKSAFVEQGRDEIAMNARRWKNTEIRALPPGSSADKLRKINVDADKMEYEETMKFEKSFSSPFFQFQHPLSVEQLAVNPTFLLAQQLQHMKLHRKSTIKKGDLVVPDMKAFVYCALDPGACNWCGCAMDETKAIRCDEQCKGNNKGTYCSVNCRQFDSAIHAVYCSNPTFRKDTAMDEAERIFRLKDSSPLRILATQLYIRVVAYCKAHNKSPADFYALNELMKAAQNPDVHPQHPSKTHGIELEKFKSVHESALRACSINLCDPNHDFYTHVLLIIGIRKFVIPVFGDRAIKPIIIDTQFTKLVVEQSKAVGAALFPDLINATPTCMSNMEFVTGVAKAGDAPTCSLSALQDIKAGEPLSFCFGCRTMLDPAVRATENATRSIYCQCELCLAQTTTDPEEQIMEMKKALIQFYRREQEQKQMKAADEAKESKEEKKENYTPKGSFLDLNNPDP